MTQQSGLPDCTNAQHRNDELPQAVQSLRYPLHPWRSPGGSVKGALQEVKGLGFVVECIQNTLRHGSMRKAYLQNQPKRHWVLDLLSLRIGYHVK